MAETVGTLMDKLSIVELRRWHTEEVMLNPEAPVDLRHDCALRLRIIDEQRADLIEELSTLWDDIVYRGKVPKVYRQLKMYNDPALRQASGGSGDDEATPQPTTDDAPEQSDQDNVISLAGRRRGDVTA